MPFKFSSASERFLSIVDHLLEKGKVTSDADFCRRVNYSSSGFVQIKRRTRNVTVELIEKSVQEFSINPTFIFTGRGGHFLLSGIMRHFAHTTGQIPESAKKRLAANPYNYDGIAELLMEERYDDAIEHCLRQLHYIELQLVASKAEANGYYKIISNHLAGGGKSKKKGHSAN